MSPRLRSWRLLLVAAAAAWVLACEAAEAPLPADFEPYGMTARTYYVWRRKPMVIELRCRVDDPLLGNPHFDRRAVKLRWTGALPSQIAGDEILLSAAVLDSELVTLEYPVSPSSRRPVERSFLHARVWLFWHGGIAMENTGWLRTFPALDAAAPIRARTIATGPNDREGVLNVTVPWDDVCDPGRERRPG